MHDMEDTAYQLKLAVRGLVFTGDPVLRENLIKGTQILHSKEFPTQVFKLKGTKYIRVNTEDIKRLNDQELEDLIKFMLSTDGYSGYDDEPVGSEPTKEDILTDAANHYRDYTGEDLRESTLVEADDFGNIKEAEEFPLTYKNFGSKNKSKEEEQQEEDEANEGDDITSATTQAAQACGMVDNPEDSKSKPEPVSIVERKEVEQALEDIETFKGSSIFNSSNSILNFDEIRDLNKKVNQLLKAFRGHKSKQKTITPKKHINAKALATDNDRFYVDTKAPKGKYIDFNLLIDMSGSMSGNPMKNAVSLIYIFNKLAQQGYVNGSVIYSTTRSHHVVQLGTADANILGLNKTQGSEGLAETVDAQVDILRNKNCICITDGDICDRPIDKQFWRKHKIVSTGVYINKNLKDPLDYTGSLSKWFDHSLVRQNLEDMIQLLVKIGIKG